MVSISSQRPVAVIDVDGVLYDFVSQLAVGAAAVTGRPANHFPPAETWDFYCDQWSLSLDEFFHIYAKSVDDHGLCAVGQPLPGAVAGWLLLRDLDVKLHIATDCGPPGNPDPARAARVQWLEMWGFVADELTFTADKAAVAKSYLDDGVPVFSIEDRPKNFDALRDVGAESFLQRQRWNLDHPAELVVNDLVEFAHNVAVRI